MKIERCKGCNDISSQDMLRFRTIENAFLETCNNYGYNEVRTPTLEYLSLFTSAGTLTSGMLRRVYSFLDWDGWSGERVVLKPDATIPAIRFFLENTNQSSSLARICYVTNTFVFEETGTKSRERWQCGAELIGAGRGKADLELISLACDAVNRLGINDIEVRVSHVGLLRALLSNIGLDVATQDKVLSRILDGNTDILDGIGTANLQLLDTLKLMLNTQSDSVNFVKNLQSLFAANESSVQTELDDFVSVIDAVESLGIKCRVDLKAGKGFEYYTGVIFRLYVGDENIGGGGRYDGLVEKMGGSALPAAGFALYVDKLGNLIATDQGSETHWKVSVRTVDDGYKRAKELCDFLRGLGFVVVTSVSSDIASDCKWEIDVCSEAPYYETLNTTTMEKSSCDELLGVVMVIGMD